MDSLARCTAGVACLCSRAPPYLLLRLHLTLTALTHRLHQQDPMANKIVLLSLGNMHMGQQQAAACLL